MWETIESLGDDYLLMAIIVIAAIIAGYYYVNTPPARPPPRIAKPAGAAGKKPAGKKPAARRQEEEVNDGKKRMKIFFGSQTGTAEDFSRTLSNDAKRFGMAARVVDLDGFEPDDLARETCVIFCLATHGEGQPTDNAKAFYQWLMDAEKNPATLANVEYAVFGLGNKTYEHYNKIARDVDSKMEELGAKKLFERGEGDDDSSLEEDFVHWKKRMWVSLCQQFGLEAPDTSEEKFVPRLKMLRPDPVPLPTVTLDDGSTMPVRVFTMNNKPKMKADGVTPVYDIKNPFMAKIIAKGELHQPESDRSCMHIEFDIGSNLTYLPGDHLGVYPENDQVLVDALLKRVGADPETYFSLVPLEGGEPYLGPCTLRQAFTDAVDITTPPRKAVLRALAEYASAPADKARLTSLASEQGSEDYNRFIKNDLRTIAEVLDTFESVRIPVEHLIELLPRLPARFYSISSSLHANPGRVHITAVLVTYKTPTGRVHNGVATTWFNKIKVGDRVPVFTRESNFHIPASKDTPLVMVGPGTGLAPFRGFLQEMAYLRAKDGKSNECGLFFGCRSRDHDFIYQPELERYLHEGVLSFMHLAFSRERGEKVYVQHRMLEDKQTIYDMLATKKGVFYVCGDANQMAKSVHQALKSILMECGGVDEAQALNMMEEMQKNGRYLQDVWY
eukprot:TRINITY_DN2394_c0_g1_i2.p1 TRINITY_DN2394_c0_g1~~TRINITY_DN2394_c0_g1_i2.p1  ORF type:complete len:672 (-),score=203.79 TRINITY_DN2394_c0_g1_i2:142-2157(-)